MATPILFVSRFDSIPAFHPLPITQQAVLSLLTPQKKRSRPAYTFLSMLDHFMGRPVNGATYSEAKTRHEVRLGATIDTLIQKGLVERFIKAVGEKSMETHYRKVSAQKIKKNTPPITVGVA